MKDAVAITPPLREERLHGRDETLAGLADMLGESDQTALLLHGPDGSGKTAIAAELARRARERGHDVWWVRAPDHSTLVVGLCAVADDLGLTGRELTAAELCEAVWRRLRTAERPWLLVVDGVDKPRGVPSPESGWLRPIRTGTGLVLVTTRDGDESLWGPWWHRHFVGPVDDGAAAAIVRQWSASQADVARVVVSTGGLPLAARMTGAAMADASLPAFRSAPALRAALEDGTWTREREDQLVYADCVNRSLDGLERQGMRHARPLLWLLTCFAPAPVPAMLLAAPTLATSPYTLFVRRGEGRRIRKMLITPLMKFGAPALFPRLTDKQLEATIEALVDRGLLHAEPSGEVLLPNAVRVVCADLPFQDQYQMLAVWLLGRVAENEGPDPEHPATWRMWHAIAPHATHTRHEVLASHQPTLRSEPVIAVITDVVERVDRFLSAIGVREDLEPAVPRRVTVDDDVRESVARQFSAAFADVVDEAARTMRSHPGLINITDLVELYGSVLRLSAQAGRIRRIINRHQDSSLRLAPDELLTFIAFFDLLGEFDTALSKVDAALLDIYRPGLVADLAEITGRDIDVLHYFNKTLVARHDLESQRFPAFLLHFLRNYSDDFGYWNDESISEIKSSVLGDSHKFWRRSGNGYMGSFGPPDFDDDDLEDLDDEDSPSDLPDASWEQAVELNGQQLAVVVELCAGLDRVRHQLGSVVADNWKLAELEMAGTTNAVSVEVNMSTGDIISNNTNATIVNRSLVQNSFIRIRQEHGDDVAAALEQLADVVEKSENQEAADNLDAFNQELQQPQPKKAVLRSLWQGLVTSLPALTQMTDLTEKIGQLVT